MSDQLNFSENQIATLFISGLLYQYFTCYLYSILYYHDTETYFVIFFLVYVANQRKMSETPSVQNVIPLFGMFSSTPAIQWHIAFIQQDSKDELADPELDRIGSDIEDGGLDLSLPFQPITAYVGDKREMLQQCFHVLGEKKLRKMLPDELKVTESCFNTVFVCLTCISLKCQVKIKLFFPTLSHLTTRTFHKSKNCAFSVDLKAFRPTLNIYCISSDTPPVLRSLFCALPGVAFQHVRPYFVLLDNLHRLWLKKAATPWAIGLISWKAF